MTNNLPKTLEELHAELASIDSDLRAERFKLQGRGFEGKRRYSIRHDLELQFPSPVEAPSPDDLSYGALTAHILDWFDARYGRKLKVIYSPSSGILDIDGDLFLLNVSMIWGQAQFEINPARLTFKYRKVSRTIPKANVLQLVDALTQAYADSIPIQQYERILRQFGWVMMAHNEMLTYHQNRLVAEASVDLDAGAKALMDGISLGHARWYFEQTVEKCLKAIIQWETGTYPKHGHKLDDLVKLSSKLIGCNLSSKSLADASCSAGARYGEIATSRDEALSAYTAALEIVAKVLKLMPGRRQMTGLVAYPGPFPDNAFDPIQDAEPTR
ncbi:HEPN domain-containing protein [Mesorhizobium sp.]|uniref:HEPN domain-containing protein n=1 Tax=Mesorhizobium sp. TaxID=1871066 RepID=UPI0025EFF89F|nr:HEPN domain-containing protein [Mesorhizobium sp.]